MGGGGCCSSKAERKISEDDIREMAGNVMSAFIGATK